MNGNPVKNHLLLPSLVFVVVTAGGTVWGRAMLTLAEKRTNRM